MVRSGSPRRQAGRTSAIVVAVAFCAAAAPGAQTPPVSGAMAPDGATATFYRAAGAIARAVQHAYRSAKDLVVHRGRGSGVDGLEGLREGSTVVVRNAVERSDRSALDIDRVADNRTAITEGVVTRIDPDRQQIAVRYDDGRSETFRLADRTPDEPGDRTARRTVVITYSNAAGQKIEHVFQAGRRGRRSTTSPQN